MVVRSFTPAISGKICSFFIYAIIQLPTDLLLAPVLKALAEVSLPGSCRPMVVVEIPPVFGLSHFTLPSPCTYFDSSDTSHLENNQGVPVSKEPLLKFPL